MFFKDAVYAEVFELEFWEVRIIKQRCIALRVRRRCTYDISVVNDNRLPQSVNLRKKNMAFLNRIDSYQNNPHWTKESL
ncbi:MAG: hypothetical protein SWO11_19125 [Thermodesulfobacteriota bacterium]|nr:hypothetical protein [Thermodesulfobacteriota bacterium]